MRCGHTCALAGVDAASLVERKPCGRFGSSTGWIYRIFLAVNDVAMESILHVWLLVLPIVKQLNVRVILSEQQLRLDVQTTRANTRGRGEKEVTVSQGVMLRLDQILVVSSERRLLVRSLAAPRPRIPKPHLRNDMQWGRLGASVPRGDSKQELIRVIVLLCSFDEDIPITVIFEDTGIKNLVLLVLFGPLCVFINQVLIRKFPLRVFVEVFHVRVLPRISFRARVLMWRVLPSAMTQYVSSWYLVGLEVPCQTHGCIVQMKMSLLETLAMVSLGVRQTEQSFLEIGAVASQRLSPTTNRGGLRGGGWVLLLLVPKRKGNVLQAVGVTNACNTVFAPSVRAGSRVVVWEV